mmetsp:Transcript_25379/g.83934  ORF Transcript_25379/g.83934 Transcript_25379/m.83934 type:complete len:208 (-) Transcript_25379:239-862(-)
MLHCRLLQRQHVHEVLAVPPDSQLRVLPHLPLTGGQLTQHEPKQRRLSAAVGPDDCDARVGPEAEVDVGEDVRPLLVGEAHVAELQIGRGELGRLGEVESNFILLGLREDHRLLLLLFLASLAPLLAFLSSLPPLLSQSLRGLRSALARRLEGSESLLLLLPRSRSLRLLGFELRAERVVSSSVVVELALVQVDGVSADGVEELHVM